MQITIPPTIIIANGFWISEPIPVDNAAGSNPKDPIRAIITTGRILLWTPSEIAFRKPIPAFKFSFITPINTIPSMALTPNRMINPIPAEIPKIVPVAQREINPPMKA
ncbi:hypothetical protein D3C80_1844410 [compost metagenome]